MADAMLALELDRALSGGKTGDEARELAALLLAAAGSARFDVAGSELDAALAQVRRPSRARSRPPLLAIPALAAAVLVAFLVLRAPGTSVQAHAARAVGATFFVVEEVHAERGLFPATDVTGYVDGARGRAHIRIFSRQTGAVAETVLRQDGSVERWLARTNTTTVAPTCEVLPGGCGEVLDPFAFYVRALEEADVHARRAGNAYELTIEGGRVDQVALVDARTYLPRRIAWRQDGRLVATIRLSALERQAAPVGRDAWTMEMHPGARVVQLTSDGRRVRVLGVAPARPAAGLRWLGARYRGIDAKVEHVLLTGGEATRVRYGSLVVWDYGRVVPPQVIQARGLPAKVFTLPGGAVVHAYYGDHSTQIADVSFGDRNVAVVSLAGDNTDVVLAAQDLRRRGSP